MLTFAVLATSALIATAPVLADHHLVVRGALNTTGLNTFRVVSGKGANVADVTALGLKVGTAPDGEQRIAFARPVFIDPVSPIAGYTVTSAVPENNPVNATFLVPTAIWDAGTPPALLFAQKDASPQPATPAVMQSYFQKLLANNNQASANLGFLMTGTGDFRFQNSNGGIYFVITLDIAFTVRVKNFAPVCPNPLTEPAPPTPQPITDFIMFWTSTRSGTAIVSANNRQISSLPIRVTGQRVAQTTLPKQVLARGANPVVITVLPDDLEAGQSPVTTSVTLTIPDLICPWNPSIPR